MALEFLEGGVEQLPLVLQDQIQAMRNLIEAPKKRADFLGRCLPYQLGEIVNSPMMLITVSNLLRNSATAVSPFPCLPPVRPF